MKGRREGWRDEGTERGMKGRREGWRNGGMKGWRDGGREGGMDGGMEGGMDGGMEGRRDGEMEGGSPGGMPIGSANSHIQKTSIPAKFSVWKNNFVYNNLRKISTPYHFAFGIEGLT